MCNISIFFWRKLRPSSDQCDAAAEPAHGLGEFQPYIPASQNDQVFGKPLQVERLDMRHGLRIRQPRYRWYCCVCSDIHEYALRGKCPFAAVAQSDLESTRSDESSIPPNQFSCRCLILFEMDFDQVLYHFSFSREDADHVDGDRSSF